MPVYCENESCEFEATEVVPVSVSQNEVEYRRYCYTCSEAYNTGAQHGHFRVMRQLQKYAEDLMKQGFVAEAGVIFAALPKLNTTDDPGEEGVEVPSLEEPDEDEEEKEDDEPPDAEDGIEPPPTREQTHEACGTCELRRTDECNDTCPHNRGE